MARILGVGCDRESVPNRKRGFNPSVYFVPFCLTIVERAVFLVHRVQLYSCKVATLILRLWQDACPNPHNPTSILPSTLGGGKADLHASCNTVAGENVAESSSHDQNSLETEERRSLPTLPLYRVDRQTQAVFLRFSFLCRKWLATLDLRHFGFSDFLTGHSGE